MHRVRRRWSLKVDGREMPGWRVRIVEAEERYLSVSVWSVDNLTAIREGRNRGGYHGLTA